jgi:hypothetical protein
LRSSATVARARDLAGVEVGEDLVEQIGEGIAGAAGVGLVVVRSTGGAGSVSLGLIVEFVRAQVVVARAHVQRPVGAARQVLVLAALLHRAHGRQTEGLADQIADLGEGRAVAVVAVLVLAGDLYVVLGDDLECTVFYRISVVDACRMVELGTSPRKRIGQSRLPHTEAGG